MGCFSFLCKKTGEPVLSSSFSGDTVHLFLLRNGEVIEHMYGNYDSYGRVFSSIKEPDDKSQTEFTSFYWKMDWSKVCDLMFSGNPKNGIAAILASEWKEGDPYPTTRSMDDPNQGWGEHGELFSSVSKEVDKTVTNPFHKVYH